MILLHIGTPDDASFQYRLPALASGVSWKSILNTPATISELEQKLLASSSTIAGIVCSNPEVLKKLLYLQSDFIPPNTKRGLTLDDYQGSLLTMPKSKIPVVFIAPLANLVSVVYAEAAAKRFIKKLTHPDSFFSQFPFSWELATPENLPELFSRWEQEARIMSCDIETAVGNEYRTINCVGYSAWLPRLNRVETLVVPFDSEFNYQWVKRFNKLPQPKIFQNGLYDNLYFMRWNCPVTNWVFDTQHLFHSMFSEFPKRLDFITAFAIRNVRYWKDDGKSGNLRDYYRYNAKDCWATLNAFLALLSEAESYAIKNYLKEFPLVFPCLHCELEGIKWDTARAKIISAEKELLVETETRKFQIAIAAPGFNVNSPLQVKNLFKVLGCGQLTSTDAANMMKAMAASPLNNRLLSTLVGIRKARKLLSTYFVAEKFWTGRVFYKLNPAGTDTGRLASSESSFWCGLQIQNIPRDDSIKQCMIADAGWLLAEIDKAQSEARCVAYLSGEEKLIDLVESPVDYHSWNAAAFFGIPYELIYDQLKKKTIDKELRDLAKRTNHGANYNMGKNVMLATMGPVAVAKAKVKLKLKGSLVDVCEFLLDTYSKTYPAVKGRWYDAIIKEIELTGKLVSARGWTRIFFKKPSRANKPLLNSAVAHSPQNLSVDIINEEFYNVWKASIYNSYFKDGKQVYVALRGKVRIKAQIHDSIFFQYKADYPEAVEIVHRIMDTKIDVRGSDGKVRAMFIPSDVAAGKTRWSELKG